MSNVNMLLLRRRAMMIRQNSTNYDSEVEYLESDGNQYIDTAVAIDTADRIIIDGQFAQKAGSNHLCGAYENGKNYVGIKTANDSYAYGAFGNSSFANKYRGTNIYVRCTYTLYARYFYMKIGSSTTSSGLSAPTNMPTTTLYLFGMNGESLDGLVGKIYAAQILKDGTLVRDFIPVRVGQVGYMYDRVSGQLFGNAGTGSFTFGNDVV